MSEVSPILDLLLKATGTGLGIVVANQILNSIKHLEKVKNLKKLLLIVLIEQHDLLKEIIHFSDELADLDEKKKDFNYINKDNLINEAITSIEKLLCDSKYQHILIEQQMLDNEEIIILNKYFTLLNASLDTEKRHLLAYINGAKGKYSVQEFHSLGREVGGEASGLQEELKKCQSKLFSEYEIKQVYQELTLY